MVKNIFFRGMAPSLLRGIDALAASLLHAPNFHSATSIIMALWRLSIRGKAGARDTLCMRLCMYPGDSGTGDSGPKSQTQPHPRHNPTQPHPARYHLTDSTQPPPIYSDPIDPIWPNSIPPHPSQPHPTWPDQTQPHSTPVPHFTHGVEIMAVGIMLWNRT